MSATRYIPDRKPRRRRTASGSGRRGLHFGTGKPRESEIQKAVLEQLMYHPMVAWAWRFNVGAGFLVPSRTWSSLLAGKRAEKSMARYVKFATPGFPDIAGMMRDGRFLGVETKRAGGTLSPEQEDFRDLIQRNGGVWFCARSAADVMRHLSHDGR